MDVESIIEGAKTLKELRVADAFAEGAPWPSEAYDTPPTVVFWRAGREVARTVSHQVNPEAAFRAVRFGVPAYGADVVVMVTDAHLATQKWFRDRKRSPKPGELQRVFHKGRTDLVKEGLSIVWAERHLGYSHFRSCLYSVDREAGKVIWGDPEGGDDLDTDKADVKMMGRVPDTLAASFEDEQMMVQLYGWGLRPQDFDLTDAQARLHADIAATRILLRQRVAVMLACYSEEEAAIVRRSMDFDDGVDYIGFNPHTGEEIHKHPR